MFNWINKSQYSSLASQKVAKEKPDTRSSFSNIVLELSVFYEDIQPGHNKVIYGEYKGETDPDVIYADLNNFDAIGSDDLNRRFIWKSDVCIEENIAEWFMTYLTKLFRKNIKVEYISVGEYVFNRGRYIVVGYKFV